MRKLSLVTAILATTALSAPAYADGHLKIVEGDPLELTIQMNHARYPVYREDWPVEQQAREWTNVHLIDVGPEGAFLPLNDLIDEHAPNLKAFFDEKPHIRSALTAADGNMYYIPYLPDGKYGRAYWIRTDCAMGWTLFGFRFLPRLLRRQWATPTPLRRRRLSRRHQEPRALVRRRPGGHRNLHPRLIGA